MREQAPDLAIEDADELPALGHRDAEQFLGCQTERVFLIHRRDVIEPVEVGQRLQVGLVLDQLLGPAVQKADMRVDALDDLTVEPQDEAEYDVRRRMLGTEIEGEVAQGVFGHNGLASAAGSTPAADGGFQFVRHRNGCRRKRAPQKASLSLAKDARADSLEVDVLGSTPALPSAAVGGKACLMARAGDHAGAPPRLAILAAIQA